MKSNRSLKVRVRVRFILFYSGLVPTGPRWCNMLQTLLRRKKYEKVISDEQLLTIKGLNQRCFSKNFPKIYWSTHFWPIFLLCTPWKEQKSFDFLVFSGAIIQEHGKKCVNHKYSMNQQQISIYLFSFAFSQLNKHSKLFKEKSK